MGLALTRDQETGRKTFYREQVRACTNPPSIAPALPAASERSACVPGVTAMKGCDFEFWQSAEVVKFQVFVLV